MDFRILGPLEALDRGERIALGGSKRRAVLALLLLNANEAVSTERLIDELWGEAPPGTAAKALQAHVSRLRKALAAASGSQDGPIVTHAYGYELRVGPDDVDAHRFERLLGSARRELADERPQEALSTLEQALGLWRGPPLADLAYEPFAQAEGARLEDLRVAANELLIEAKLALGRHAEVIGELEGLIEQHPYRERLRAQLMLALYRADRQADALQAFQNARATLVEELGIEPGEPLRALESAVLSQDPALARPIPHSHVPEPAAPELPSGVVTFVLTDIEGSSALWEADFDSMAAALELHDGLIARAADAHDGRLLKTKGEGDSTLTVFRRASSAVGAAAELRRSLAGAAWPPGIEPRVRIAVHTGEAHERDGDYFGPALNRAARLRALSQEGAVLLSQATAEIVKDRLPEGAQLIDVGPRDLRGLSRPEQVFELRLPGADGGGAGLAETRKTVTVLFACVMDSSEDGDALDAEAGRRVSAQLLGDMRTVLDRHGGAVRDYPGEALMAVYGVPRLHEDDAVRAVRAAAELEELAGARLRIGIGTGEVLAGIGPGEGALVAGTAVNTAKRLEEQAAPGEILLDERTHRLVRGFVETEAAAPSGSAVRLVAMRADGERARGLDSPLVGRAPQLKALTRTFAAATAGRTCHLVTILGGAGVGKSRLVAEFTGTLGEAATVVCGRCLPYGEGITYWPLTEIVRDLPEGFATPVADDPKADAIVTVLSDALGMGPSPGATSEKISWAVRRLFEAVARRRPLVVVLDDLQWAEPTFLDLVEHVADLARDAPIVLLCMARPELLDVRPGWGGGKLNAASVLLEPLGPDETGELLANLLSRATVPHEALARLGQACEGNPLFAEELLSMLIDEGLLQRDRGGWTLSVAGGLPVPPTIHALLAARLERLPDDERALLARVSVVGTVFDRDAARELAPASLVSAVERSLTALVRRDLIRPDRSSFVDDEAFRFRHILIRDAAYRSLPKEARAELHERFAGWIEGMAGPRLTELEEIAGYHLEQAHRFLAELGPVDAEAERLAAGASERLESAGRRALLRGDLSATVGLLQRAAALVHGDDARGAALLPDLGAALIAAGRLAEAAEALEDARRAAEAAADEPAAARAHVQRQFLALQRGESAGTEEAVAVVEQTLPVFRRAADEHGWCGALRLRAWGHWIEGQAEAAASAWEEAAVHAGNAGADHERVEILGWIASSLFFGPSHVDEAIRRCEAIRSDVESNIGAVAEVLQPLAGLHAMQGRFDTARELLATSEAAFAELGLTLNSAVSHHAAMVDLLAGDPGAAERSLRRGYATLEEMGDRALLSTTAAFLGQALLAQDRAEEAERLAAVSAELGAPDDLITQVLWRGVRARSLGGRGELREAEQLARESVALADRTDFVNQRADARSDLGAILRQRGLDEDARVTLDEAIRLYDLKGNTVAVAGVEAALASAPGL
jgi:predicted ATPase/class 3 adenylate cyclase